jgi:hypothetical protein
MCADKEHVTYMDNTLSFKLGDGSINDGYYLADGVHITRAAVNKLASNLKLGIIDKAEGVCKDIARRAPGKPEVSSNKPYPRKDDHYGEMADDASELKIQRRHKHRGNKGRRYEHYDENKHRYDDNYYSHGGHDYT